MERPNDKIVRITSEGAGNNTHVFLEGGGVLRGVYALVAHVDADSVMSVDLSVHLVEFDVKAHVRSIEYRCPLCSEEMTHTCD